jgi:hypothetical protein
MPMDFPDFESLKRAAEIQHFRQPQTDETEADYRRALADHVAPIDFVESQEIRTSKGHDKWGEPESADLLLRSLMRGFDSPRRRGKIIIR